MSVWGGGAGARKDRWVSGEVVVENPQATPTAPQTAWPRTWVAKLFAPLFPLLSICRNKNSWFLLLFSNYLLQSGPVSKLHFSSSHFKTSWLKERSLILVCPSLIGEIASLFWSWLKCLLYPAYSHLIPIPDLYFHPTIEEYGNSLSLLTFLSHDTK